MSDPSQLVSMLYSMMMAVLLSDVNKQDGR
jgi:hypothetical protein